MLNFREVKEQAKSLRRKTGFSFLECAKALSIHDGDEAKAILWLKSPDRIRPIH
jgi:translation elongation factor EF-Ts